MTDKACLSGDLVSMVALAALTALWVWTLALSVIRLISLI
jgi:hypothetical protein